MKSKRGYKLSEIGLQKAKESRLTKGWPVDDERWLIEASKVVDPSRDWDNYFYADNISMGTWKRFLYGYGSAICKEAFSAYCIVLGLNPKEVKFDENFNFLIYNNSAKTNKIKKNLSQINDFHKKYFYLANILINQEVHEISKTINMHPYKIIQFLETVAWSIRNNQYRYIDYLDILEIAYDSQLPKELIQHDFAEFKSLKVHESDSGIRVIKFQNEAIRNYLISRILISSLKSNKIDKLSEFLTTYDEDYFIANYIDQLSSENNKLFNFLSDSINQNIPNLLATNISGIIAKTDYSIKAHYIESLYENILHSEDISQLYRSEVFRRILGGGDIDTVIPFNDIKKLEIEIFNGKDPIAIAFCLKELSLNQYDISTHIKNFFDKYSIMIGY